MPAGVLPSIRERLGRSTSVPADQEVLARCGDCGYELHGLLDPKSKGLCPECGCSFNPYAPHQPWTRAEWAWFVVGGCGPTIAMLAIAWASTFIEGDALRMAIGVAGPFWVFTLAYAAFVWPALWTNLRKDERSRPERRRMLMSCYAGAVLPVAALIIVSLL